MPPTPRGPRPLSSEITSPPRRLSSRKTSESKSFLSRKLSKQQRSPDHPAQRQDADIPARSSASQDGEAKGKGKEVEQSSRPEQPPRPQHPHRSVIPDRLAELPAWYAKDVEITATSAIQFRAKYPIHNRMGPRWYRNHHLAPPSLDKRPPSFFSPSFPPMAAAQERSQDSTKMPGPSRTPSGSPLPTPNSSEVRIHDVRVRTRKLSNTAHDNVDMMDVSDPWGTNWHHQSPYDLGAHADRAPDAPEPPSVPRPRRMSTTSATRHKTVARSPLSQSTSAVHLSSEPLATGRIPRRLSKRRKPFQGLFGSDRGHDPWRAGSAPVTPVEFGQALGRKISKTGSFIAASISPSTNSLTPTEKRMKRGSVLGRLARRFSVLKRTDTFRSTPSGIHSARVSMDMTYDRNGELPYSVERRSTSPQKQFGESPPRRAKTDGPRRRIPIPSPFVASPVKSPRESYHREPEPEPDTQSISSLVEERGTVGKLTVANPDDSFNSNSEDTHQVEPPSPASSSNHANGDTHRILSEELRTSPTSMDNIPHIPRAPLSVISEGETYLSSPRAPPVATPQLFPMSPPSIPSVLSLPMLRKPPPTEAPPPSPPPPDLPSLAPLSKIEHSLPPTPEGSRSPTPEPTEPVEPTSYLQNKLPESLPLTSSSLPSIRGSSIGYVENTPLSRVSMIVNPPTPQPPSSTALPTPPSPQRSADPSTAAPLLSSPLAVVAFSQEQSHLEKVPSREPSPTKKDKDSHQRTRSRRTETFKLVRTSSGHEQTISGVFAVDGEHWQVVESPADENKRRERSKTRESDSTKKRESRKVEKESGSDDSDQHRKHEARRKSVSHREPSSSEPPTMPPASRTRSPEVPTHRTTAPEKTDRRRSTRESREVREAQQDVVRSTQTPVIYAAPIPVKQPALNGHSSGARVDRHPSTSTRPASELNSLAELNALKAADAWEIERLWKGRSMVYGTESTALPGTRHNITSDSRPSTMMSADLHRASSIPSVDQASTLGTSHTYFVYQAPASAAGSPQVSPAQAQSLYPSFMHQPSPTNPEARSRARSSSDSVPFPSSNPPQIPSPRSNPLPEPPRLSSYKPSPIPASFEDKPNTSDYWMKLAGVTVLH
ncbi:hypothetical protein BC835DRAFT_1418990 [Cytidiella melzeri]|nr:hypothetical protein BC835DRAFT_1418990 [Cytidiella melzeri]